MPGVHNSVNRSASSKRFRAKALGSPHPQRARLLQALSFKQGGTRNE